MNRGEQDSYKNQQDKDNMLDELESLSKMLEENKPRRRASDTPISQDIPILKSFVEDVPTLSDSLEGTEPNADTIDNSAATFTTSPLGPDYEGSVSVQDTKLDVSFLNNPAISGNLSAEFQQQLVDGVNDTVLHDLQEKAGPLVDALVKANLPRLEAELRMKLEQEVDRLLSTIKKNNP